MVMDQMIARIEKLHKWRIHGNITPASFCIGPGD